LDQIEDVIVAKERNFPFLGGILFSNLESLPKDHGACLFAFLDRAAQHIGLTACEPIGGFVAPAQKQDYVYAPVRLFRD